MYCHGAGSNCLSAADCSTRVSQLVANCSTDSTTPELYTPLALTGGGYFDTTKFQELSDPVSYLVKL
jgi:hypothetical protein